MTLRATFESALYQGNKKYQTLLKDGWFDSKPFDSASFAYLLPIKEARRKIYGIPEPVGPIPKEPPPDDSPIKLEAALSDIDKYFAVIVGTNSFEEKDYYDQKQICPYDAETLYEQLLVSGFHPSRLHLLANDSLEWPESWRIVSCLKSMANRSASNDLLLFYYSGAIKPDGKNYYLYTFDMLPSNLASTAVPLAIVRQIMTQALAREKLIILDIYTIEIDAQEQDSKQLVDEFMQSVIQQLEGLAVLASYKKKHKNLACSLFTHALVEQFQQLAGSDHCITTSQIYDNIPVNEFTLYPPAPNQAKQAIICLSGKEIGSYFLYAYRYLVGMQKSLERVQDILNNKDKVVQDDFMEAIRVLQLIQCYEEPEAQYPSNEESRLNDQLQGLYQRIDLFMNRDIAALLKTSKPADIKRECERASALLQPILLDIIQKTNELRAAIMPSEQETSHLL